MCFDPAIFVKRAELVDALINVRVFQTRKSRPQNNYPFDEVRFVTLTLLKRTRSVRHVLKSTESLPETNDTALACTGKGSNTSELFITPVNDFDRASFGRTSPPAGFPQKPSSIRASTASQGQLGTDTLSNGKQQPRLLIRLCITVSRVAVV